mmetsp:Transcript_4747/g.9311  ORF Transcript_4747/g.9311 Transcript_4747/m.9311 type:complete len:693 (+) Transcript_4747:206-2284(+)|eukprot:CAMPEP_0196129882 /NCGR_PEP_ID=MMETSP0910-20130528/440_1 /TAXON_ID=49265 /ORGANISM="Thalassiosira rotula, Strain GSO102" /LENGTH=692 /DNA_ID=CAMNT_0041389077 /DNA_START=120 /DNA_END=2198 /DNA_ORIENTATION=-
MTFSGHFIRNVSNLHVKRFKYTRLRHTAPPCFFCSRQFSTTPSTISQNSDGKNVAQSLPSSSVSGPPLPSDDEKQTSLKISQTDSTILQRLYEIAEPERKLILASAATLAVTSSITLLLPYACGHVLDAAILEASTTPGTNADGSGQFSPVTIALGLFGLTGTAGLGVYARSLMLNMAGNRIVSRIRQRLFSSILSQESAFFDKTKSGDMISRLSNDSWFIKSAMTTEAVAGLRGVVMSVGSTSLLFYTSPKLALVSLLSIPPVFLMARIVGRKLKEKQKTVQSLHGTATDIAEEVFGGIKTVQLFNAERSECDRYDAAIANAHDEEISVGRTKAAFDGVVHVAANGAVLLVMGYGGTLVLANELSAGDLTGFLMYSLLMAGNVSSLSGTYAEMMKSIAAAGRVFDVIDRVPEIPSSLRTASTDEERDAEEENSRIPFFAHGKDRESISIRFDGVEFTYPIRPDAPVIGPDFSLDIDAGSVVALVGGSGSGKSTVSLLLARLYNIDKGNIFLNGRDLMDIEPAIVREQIGVVSQEPLLFSGSISDNIKFGRPDASDDEIREAARAAHVTHFTDDLPLGLETEVGPRGTQLSGGQKQRVAIARVMLKDPPICVLDEATSALDARSEYHINQALKAMAKGRTVISIAHRLSTIKEADRIAVLKGGEIVETGTFHELIESEGAFHRLVKQQLTDI